MGACLGALQPFLRKLNLFVFILYIFPQTGLPVWGSYSFQRVASLGRMILPLSPGLHPILGALGRMSLHLSSTCLSHLSATLGAFGRMSLRFTLVSHTRLPHLSFILVSHSGCLGPHEFTLVSHLSLTLVSHSGCLGPHEFYTCLLDLSPALDVLGHMSLHLSSTCLPHLSPTLGVFGRMSLHLSPHEFTLVSHTCLPHLSPTLVSHTCLPHLSPTLVSHTCLRLWVPWAA